MEKPNLPETEVQSFAFSVGKAIQNFGTIEYLVNELTAILTADSVIASHLVKQNIAKRLDVLEPLAEPMHHGNRFPDGTSNAVEVNSFRAVVDARRWPFMLRIR